MQITIVLDTAKAISERDQAVLLALANGHKVYTEAEVEVQIASSSKDFNPDADAQAAAEKPKPAPAKKAAPAKPKPLEGDDPVDESGEEASLATAITKATELVSNGESAKVRAALAAVGAKRVSELTIKTIPAFLEALDA